MPLVRTLVTLASQGLLHRDRRRPGHTCAAWRQQEQGTPRPLEQVPHRWQHYDDDDDDDEALSAGIPANAQTIVATNQLDPGPCSMAGRIRNRTPLGQPPVVSVNKETEQARGRFPRKQETTARHDALDPLHQTRPANGTTRDDHQSFGHIPVATGA